MTRSVWVDQPNDARSDLKSRFGITCPVYDGRWLSSLQQPLTYLKDAQGKFGSAGIFLCSQGADSLGAWPNANTTAAVAWAIWANDMVQKKIAPGTSGAFPKVHLNCEIHDSVWVLTMLKEWRRHQPHRETYLLVEGMQGGWLKAIGADVGALGVTVMAECFRGRMVRTSEAAVLRDLLDAGVPREQAGVVIRGEDVDVPPDGLPAGDTGWWGTNTVACAFTQGRLPS